MSDISNPILKKGYEQFLARRKMNRSTGSVSSIVPRHTTSLTWQNAGTIKNTPGYFLISYCTKCLQGTVVNFVYDIPAVASYDELGVTLLNTKDWNTHCKI